jgi:hypothetical protein
MRDIYSVCAIQGMYVGLPVKIRQQLRPSPGATQGRKRGSGAGLAQDGSGSGGREHRSSPEDAAAPVTAIVPGAGGRTSAARTASGHAGVPEPGKTIAAVAHAAAGRYKHQGLLVCQRAHLISKTTRNIFKTTGNLRSDRQSWSAL